MNKRDLVILVADKDMAQALKGIFERPEALGIQPIEPVIHVETQHDAACAQRGVSFLSMFSENYRHGLLMFDHFGSGREQISPQNLQDNLSDEFRRTGWGERARAVVLVPELEAWVWGTSPHVAEVAGWTNRNYELRRWLREEGWLENGEVKPNLPSKAFRAALRAANTNRSSSLYLKIARKVSLTRCKDEAFREFKEILRNWFPSAN